MRSQVTLLLFGMFFTKALALKCNECLPPLTGGSCSSSTQKDCIETQCASATTSMTVLGTKTDFNMQSCGTADACAIQSINLGITKVTNNAQCCGTDLCNTATVPALTQSANGKMCYTCESNDCSKTVNCEGIEDRCITATVEQSGVKSSVKGCVSKNICDAAGAAGASSQQGLAFTKMTCCTGNLCNGAEIFTLSFLIMLVPLLSSILLQ